MSYAWWPLQIPLQGADVSQHFLHMSVISCFQLFLFHFLLKVVYLHCVCLRFVMYLAVLNFSDGIWNLKFFLMCIFPLCPRLLRRGSLDNVMTRLRAGHPNNCGHISGRRKTFISSPKRPAGSPAHPTHLYNGYWGLLSRRQSDWGVFLTTKPPFPPIRLRRWLRMSGAVSPLCHIPSCCVQQQLRFCFLVLWYPLIGLELSICVAVTLHTGIGFAFIKYSLTESYCSNGWAITT